MIRKAGFWFAALCLFVSAQARSAVVPELADELRGGLEWLETSMDSEPACNQQDAWYFRRFWLRLRPRAVIQLPALKLSVMPEVELLLERDFPDGWGTYKP